MENRENSHFRVSSERRLATPENRETRAIACSTMTVRKLSSVRVRCWEAQARQAAETDIIMMMCKKLIYWVWFNLPPICILHEYGLPRGALRLVSAFRKTRKQVNQDATLDTPSGAPYSHHEWASFQRTGGTTVCFIRTWYKVFSYLNIQRHQRSLK